MMMPRTRRRLRGVTGLALRLGLPYALVISHEAGDEGTDYLEYLQEIIAGLKARVIFGAAHFGEERGQADRG